jgi:hypothetical protein
MTKEDALTKIKTLLGKGLPPAAVPEVEKVLQELEENSYQWGFEQAQQTVGEWNKPLGY